jgi:hypothetical protein
MDPGFDAEGDDPAEADEEWRYFKKQPKSVESNQNPQKVEQPKEKRKEEGKREKRNEVFDPDVVPNDKAAMVGDAIAAQMTYDRENLKIEVNSTFVGKDAFMLLMKQYAIKWEFETFVVHSDRNRYRAKCAVQNVIGRFMQRNFLVVLHSRLFNNVYKLVQLSIPLELFLILILVVAYCFYFRRSHMC